MRNIVEIGNAHSLTRPLTGPGTKRDAAWRELDRKILTWVTTNIPGDKIEEIAERSGVSSPTIRRHLKSLIVRGKVVRVAMKKRITRCRQNGQFFEQVVRDVRYRLNVPSKREPTPTLIEQGNHDDG